MLLDVSNDKIGINIFACGQSNGTPVGERKSKKICVKIPIVRNNE